MELIAIYDYFLVDRISQFGSNGNYLFVTSSICRCNTSYGYICDKKIHSRFSPSTWHLSAIVRYGTENVRHQWKTFVALLKTKYKPCCMNVFWKNLNSLEQHDMRFDNCGGQSYMSLANVSLYFMAWKSDPRKKLSFSIHSFISSHPPNLAG